MISFSQIPDLEDTKSRLIKNVLSNRLPHSQIFSSIEGGGALPLALAYAKFLICDNPSKDDSCNSCNSCAQMDHSNYPEIHYSFPVERKGSDTVCNEYRKEFAQAINERPFLTNNAWRTFVNVESKQLLIPSKEAESIIRSLSLTRHSSKPRIFILWQPENLNPSSANKLLKSLEEPNDGTYFILVSHHTERVLPTILSRCVHVKVPSFSETDIKQYLVSHGVNNSDLSNLGLNTEGSIGFAQDSLKVVEQKSTAEERFVEWVRALYRGNLAELVGWSEETATINREKLKYLLDFSTKVFQQSFQISYKSSRNAPFLFEGFDSSKFAPFIKASQMDAILQILENCKADIIRNGHAKTILLDTSLKLTKYIGKA